MTAITLVSLNISAAPAKKVCNDLKVSQCKKRTDCQWIKKAKNKNGKETKAYCRKKKEAKMK